MHFCIRAAAAALVIVVLPGASAFELDSISTGIARAGDEIVVTGSGFDPGGTYKVLIGELEIAPSAVTAASLAFTVPAEARTGAFGISEEGSAPIVTDTILEITRIIDAQFDASLQMNLAGYGIGTFAGDSASVSAPFAIDISVGEPTVVSGSRSEAEPVFMAVATDTTTAVTLSARSTVEAMLFSFPGIYTPDPGEADARLAFMDGHPSVDAAAAIIESAVAGGSDFLGAPGLREAMLEAMEATLGFASGLPPAPLAEPAVRPALVAAPGGPPYREDYVKSVFDVPPGTPPFPHYLAIPGFDEEDFRHFPSKVAEGDPNKVPIIRYSRDARGVPTAVFPFGDRKWELLPFLTFEGTPVDNLVAAYRLNPSAFQSIDAIRNLEGNFSQVFARDGNLPVFTDVFSGGGSTKLGGYPLSLSPYVDKIIKAAFPTEAGNKEVVLPRDRSGVYLVRMFNGTLTSPQDGLIAALPDGHANDQEMYVLNGSLAVLETAGLLIKGGKLRDAAIPVDGKKKSSSGLVSADDIIGVYRAMIIEIDRKLARGELDYTFLSDVFTKGVRQVAKIAFDKSLFDPLKPSLKHEVARVKNVLSVLDLLSDVPQAAGRIHFTLNLGHFLGKLAGSDNVWTTLGVDSLIVVVGDPFRPEITRFSPAGGQRDSVVLIHGQNFSPVKENNLVRFGDPGTSPDDPLSGSQPATVIAASRTLLIVQVPELEGGDMPIETPIFVTVTGKGTVSSERLAHGPSTFTVLPDPEILSVSPDPPITNGLMEIIGRGFDPEPTRNRVLIDNDVELAIAGGGPDRLVVRVPNTDNEVNVRVAAGRRTSAPFAFTPVTPVFAPGEAPAGWSMVVSTTADGNSADAHLTLREAMLLAAGGETGGGLGRLINRRPPESELPWGSYESDWIVGWDTPEIAPGIGSGDAIFFDSALGAAVFTASSPLPAMRSHDYIRGQDVSLTDIRSSGIEIQNATGVSVTNLTFSLSDGPGILVTGDCSHLRLRDLQVLAGGTAGIVVDGDVHHLFVDGCLIDLVFGPGIAVGGSLTTSTFGSSAVRNATGDGIYVEGNVTHCRFDGVDVRNSGGHGIHLNGPGVRLNRFIGTQRFVVGVNLPFEPVECSQNGGFGILAEGGASDNELDGGDVRFNALGGIRVDGPASSGNQVGPGSTYVAAVSFPVVEGNQGPGVWVTSPKTLVGGLSIVGNTDGPGPQGHGILIDGPDAVDAIIHAVRIGYDNRSTAPAPFPNSGSGIVVAGGAQRVLIGTLRDPIDDPSDRNFIGGNLGNGIVIEGPGTADIRVNHTDIGRVHTNIGNSYNFYGRPTILYPMGNGENGISVRNGARDVVIGSRELLRDVHIVSHTNGAGIEIADAATTNVTVLGCHIGTGYFGETEGNLHGIRITDGSGGNLIGLQGDPTTFSDSQGIRLYQVASHNTIMANLHAGILLESGGMIDGTIVPGEPPPTPTNANVVINNYIGTFNSASDSDSTHRPNKVGILIRGDAFANRIGGNAEGEGNRISYNDRAGIEIQGVQVPNPALANRIIGNSITRTGWFPNWPLDHAATPNANLVGIGILLGGGAAGNIVGEEGGAYNSINQNAIGILIDGVPGGTGAGNQATRCRMSGNYIAGAMLRNTSANTIGPQCIVRQNGFTVSPFVPYGGIAVVGAPGGNRVIGNIIGSDENPFVLGNKPDGITILNSRANQVGEPGVTTRNVIVNSNRHGVLVSGAGSSGNRIQGNRIGVHDDPNLPPAPNAGSGIRLENGAANNRIGGTFTPLQQFGRLVTVSGANTIRGNGLHGIIVDGAATVGNEILDNAISGHAAGRGIETINGGNSELPPPLLTSVTPARIDGTVDPAKVPDGSTVQVYADPDDEGLDLIGESEVKDGMFTVFPAGITAPRINATVTHALTRSTSEFSSPGGGGEIQGLSIRRRAGSAPADRSVPANSENVVVVPIELTAVGADALVDRIRLIASGSANEPVAITRLRLWVDKDADGTISPGDLEMLSGATVPSNDGPVELPFELIVPADSTVQLLVTATLSGDGAVGETLEFRVADAQAVDSFGQPTPFPLPETGVFPVAGDRLTLTESEVAGGFASFMQGFFPGVDDPMIVGPNADAEGDQATNLEEYAEGTDPAKPGPRTTLATALENGFLVLTFRQRNNDPKLRRAIEFAAGLGGWAPDEARILEDRVVSTEGDIDLREVRVSLAGVAAERFFARIVWTLLP